MGSKKKHRNKENEFYGSEGSVNNPLGLDFNSLSSLFGNIDQNQLMSMIQMLGQNGIDMDNIGGFEQNQNNGSNNLGNSFNNMGISNIGNSFNSMASNNSGNAFNNLGNDNNYHIQNSKNIKEEKSGELDTATLINKLMGNNADLNFTEDRRVYEKINKHGSTKSEEEVGGDDPNIEMLLAMRKIVGKERVRFIDKIIQLYINGEFGEF